MKWCVANFLMLLFCGVQLHAQQADTNSVESIKIKAENGEAYSETVLGAIYEFGLRGASKDVVEAMKWFRKAAEQNFAPAQYEMGICFANGQGVEKDTVEAVKWYLRAAGQNLAVAQYNLGVCYRDGQGVVKDEEEAAIWFRKAIDSAPDDAGKCARGDTLLAQEIFERRRAGVLFRRIDFTIPQSHAGIRCTAASFGRRGN